MKKIRKESLIKKAREALNEIWESSYIKTKCWARKGDFGRLSGATILISSGNELVGVSEDYSGKLKVLEFVVSRETNLGSKIKSALKRKGLI